MPLIAELLARRVRSAGSAPLVTYYDVDEGSRTELSATTFANWVAKTSNLLTDELLLDPGASVELLLAARHPGHWMTLVWATACWQTGAVVTLGRPEEAALVVCGPDHADVDPGDAELVACSLHPLGLGLTPPVPSRVVDYATEVRAQPDVWNVVPVATDALAWLDAERELDQTGLVAGGPAPAQRLLVRPGGPWETLRDAVVTPLRDGGSSVVLVGTTDEQRVREIGLSERVDALVAEPEGLQTS
ncbi:TIGR03089 family protein [Microlunatus spumicola]|uniref:TIGR03089 family protein n=1 Tax=Microlunatus spumicola TaxID=81499 RepID=A0ABP6XSA3_9ACTN